MAEMSVAEMCIGRNVRGRKVRGRNVLVEMSVAEMSVAEMSEHRDKHGGNCVYVGIPGKLFSIFLLFFGTYMS